MLIKPVSLNYKRRTTFTWIWHCMLILDLAPNTATGSALHSLVFHLLEQVSGVQCLAVSPSTTVSPSTSISLTWGLVPLRCISKQLEVKEVLKLQAKQECWGTVQELKGIRCHNTPFFNFNEWCMGRLEFGWARTFWKQINIDIKGSELPLIWANF